MATDLPPSAPPRRAPRDPRTMPAGHALAAVLVALLVGALLNAQDLRATAERQPFGWKRSVALAVVGPLATVADAVALDTPRNAIDVALGRAAPEPPRVAVAAPERTARPSATPSPSPSPSGPPPTRAITAAAPLRLYIGGDSMVGQFGPALGNLGDRSDLVDSEVQYEFESGLTRPDFVDWPARLREVGATQDPEAVVLLFGGNDAQPMQLDGVVEEPGSPAWQTEYRARVGAVMRELTTAGRRVYWVGMPIVKSDTFRPRVEMLNEIYATEAAQVPGVTYVPSWELFTGPDGGYSEYLPDDTGASVDMRLNDGVHLTTAGGQRLAQHVWEVIASDWGLPADV